VGKISSCAVIDVSLAFEVILEYNDAPQNDPEDQEPWIDEANLVEVTVCRGDRSMVLKRRLLEKSVSALCTAKAFPAKIMSLAAIFWGQVYGTP